MITMKTLKRDMLIHHIKAKQSEYKRRRDASQSQGDTQKVNDYQNRLVVINNLLIHITRGDFDMEIEEKTNYLEKQDRSITPMDEDELV